MAGFCRVFCLTFPLASGGQQQPDGRRLALKEGYQALYDYQRRLSPSVHHFQLPTDFGNRLNLEGSYLFLVSLAVFFSGSTPLFLSYNYWVLHSFEYGVSSSNCGSMRKATQKRLKGFVHTSVAVV